MVADGARTAGVELEVVDSPHLTRTCVSVLARDTGRLTEIYEHPTPVGRELFGEVLRRVPTLLDGRPGWCLVSGGMPRDLGGLGEPGDPGDRALADVLLAARAAGVRLAVDSHGPALRAAVAAAPPEVLKVNRAEAAELVGRPAGDHLIGLALAVHALTGGLAVVTDGTAGAVAVDGSIVVQAVLTDPVGAFPVGSGDSFLGGLLVGLGRGEGVAQAMRLATACGTANALVAGAARFDRSVVEQLLPEVRVSVEPTGATA
jgi:1-phosphofructokinase/tagatose 6-phosphate kinase